MADESDLEKTEQPSARRLEKAREEGQVARSREWVTFALLAAALGGLQLTGGVLESRLGATLRHGLAFERNVAFDPASMLALARAQAFDGLIAVAPVLAVMAAVALLAPMMLGGLLFSPQSIAPDFKKLDPMAGLGRMFSGQALAELLKTIAKSLLIGGVGYLAIRDNLGAMADLMTQPPRAAIPHVLALVMRCCTLIVGSLLLVALVDVPYQLWSLYRKLRMSREDVRQEHKESEGDPQLKARIRRQQQALARRRMMAQVPKADLVLTNPTHFAVALRYDDGAMSAPRVVAKGTELVAQRIREIAREHRVEVVESPALARSLYKHTDLNQEIPAGLYTAVAELLAWVYRLRRWRADGGLEPAAPAAPVIPPALQYPGVPA
ncbi:flagellar biosynthesis protein FlhB [Ramlibacter sp.]|uniref:flagellar biosynthesis protein FlhB n=1 Tax=Ramlibacter sp. TaxID=1917967 RepID=UPI002CD5EFF4|nr:flagellar biosynthesis protein FlhB [Ramlibacter sp.]HWI83354.1 flagellar biosynthesis protein FlhB [Ramlibacter sp.]